MEKILLVCLGNICRSPTAQGVLESKLRAHHSTVVVDSCGTGAWHVGSPPDQRSIDAAQSAGYDLSTLRARQLCDADFVIFDTILAMDARNLADVIKIMPRNYSGTIGLFLDYAKDVEVTEVPDPYHGGIEGFQRVISLAEKASDGLIQQLAS